MIHCSSFLNSTKILSTKLSALQLKHKFIFYLLFLFLCSSCNSSKTLLIVVLFQFHQFFVLFSKIFSIIKYSSLNQTAGMSNNKFKKVKNYHFFLLNCFLKCPDNSFYSFAKTNYMVLKCKLLKCNWNSSRGS